MGRENIFISFEKWSSEKKRRKRRDDDVRCKKSENSNLTGIYLLILRIDIPFFFSYSSCFTFTNRDMLKNMKSEVEVLKVKVCLNFPSRADWFDFNCWPRRDLEEIASKISLSMKRGERQNTPIHQIGQTILVSMINQSSGIWNDLCVDELKVFQLRCEYTHFISASTNFSMLHAPISK